MGRGNGRHRTYLDMKFPGPHTYSLRVGKGEFVIEREDGTRVCRWHGSDAVTENVARKCLHTLNLCSNGEGELT